MIEKKTLYLKVIRHFVVGFYVDGFSEPEAASRRAPKNLQVITYTKSSVLACAMPCQRAGCGGQHCPAPSAKQAASATYAYSMWRLSSMSAGCAVVRAMYSEETD